MKRMIMCVIAIFAAITSWSQNSSGNEIPYIEVTGSADIEIEPDEIHLDIIISGYWNEKSKQNVMLETVDQQLMQLLTKSGISKSNIILKDAATRGYWQYAKPSKKDYAGVTKQYEIVFNTYQQLNTVLEELPGPKEGFLNVNIAELKNKNISEYRKQTKIEAIKAAKTKAEYLLENIGSSLGKVIQVIELDEDNWGWDRPYLSTSNVISQTSITASDENDDTSIRKIKLRYRIKARFEIK